VIAHVTETMAHAATGALPHRSIYAPATVLS